MALIKCPKCGKSFSEHADKCPACNLSVSDFHSFNLQKYKENREERLKMESLAKQQENLIKQLKDEIANNKAPYQKKNKVYWISSIGILAVCLIFLVYWNMSQNAFSSQYDFSEYDKPLGAILEKESYYSSLWLVEQHEIMLDQYQLPSTCVCYEEDNRCQIWNDDRILFEIIHYANFAKTKITAFENLKDSLSSFPNYPSFIYDGSTVEYEGGYVGIEEGIACYFKFNGKKHYLSEKRIYRSHSYYEYEKYDIDGNVISSGSNR